MKRNERKPWWDDKTESATKYPSFTFLSKLFIWLDETVGYRLLFMTKTSTLCDDLFVF
jgi:hypothetical protein